MPDPARVLLDHPTVAVAYGSGPELVVEHLNGVARSLLGTVRPEGRPFREIAPRVYEAFEPAIREVFESGERVELRDVYVPLSPDPYPRRFFTIALDPVPGPGGTVGGIVALAFETTGAVRAEARAELFARMVSELAADPDLGAVVRTSLRRAVELLGGDDGTVWLLEGDRLRCVFETPSAGRLGQSVPTLLSPRFWKGVEAREPFYLAARQAEGEERAWYERLELAGSLVLPLGSGPSVLGALVVSDREIRPRTAADLSFGRAIAAQCALAIHRARASRAEEAARRRLLASQRLTAALAATRTVQEVVAAVLDDGLEPFGAMAAAVVLPHPTEPALLRLAGTRGLPEEKLGPYQAIPLDSGLPLATAMREARALWIPNDAALKEAFPGLGDVDHVVESHAWAVLPLLVEDRCLGAVGLVFGEEHAFPADVREEMLSHARKCAQALERVRLDEALRRERAHLSALLDALPAGVSVADAAGRVVAVNATAIAQAGPGEQLLGRSALASIPVGATHLDGRPVVSSELPLARALAGERVDHEEVRVPAEGGARGRVLSLSAVPLRDEDGAIAGAIEAAWDVTAQKDTEGALRTATLALDVANRQKDQFLAMLAHELRNPLAAIRSAAHVIRGRAATGRSTERAVDILERQAGNASRILDDLLDVSRITRGLVELRRERVRLEDVVASAVESQRGLAETLGHRVNVRLAPGVVVDGDPTRLEQVVANLLNNAVKYTPPGGNIWVELTAERGRSRLRVRDEGNGIPPELLPRVFELFVQGETGLARSSGGLGLGLTLVKRLVELHGGEVTASSEGSGRGSTFEVTFPLAPPAPTPLPRAPATAAVSTRRVLVVEDNPDAAETLVEVLKLLGHEARWAPDGPAALVLSERFAPDVVLLDIGLPDMDGYEVARRLRASSRGALLQIVAVSGYAQAEDQERARAAGFDLHLTKPVEPASLARAVGQAGERRAAH